MAWRGDDEHAVLVDSAFSLLDDLEGLPGRLLHGEVHHYIHTELADRARSLALHLSAALTLTSLLQKRLLRGSVVRVAEQAGHVGSAMAYNFRACDRSQG